MKTFWIVILVLALLAASFIVGRVTKPVPEPEIAADTVQTQDTTRYINPEPTNSKIVRYDSSYLHKAKNVGLKIDTPPSSNDTLTGITPARAHSEAGRRLLVEKSPPNDDLSNQTPATAYSEGSAASSKPDSALVVIPIEQKEYKTEDYRAIIEGYKASLVFMEVYPKTTTITRAGVRERKTQPKWGIGVQLGYGIPINGKAVPYIGIGVQYNLITW